MRATGGGCNKQAILSSLEETVSNIICLDAVINPTGISLGLPTAPVQMQQNNEIFIIDTSEISEEMIVEPNPLEYIESSPHDLPTASNKSSLKNKPIENVRHSLLKKQTEVQENLYVEVKESLKKIEIVLKENQRINRKRYDLEKERLELYKDDLKKKEKQRREKNNLKLMNYELKKKKNLNYGKKIITITKK